MLDADLALVFNPVIEKAGAHRTFVAVNTPEAAARPNTDHTPIVEFFRLPGKERK
jgi:hypothetical protein